MVKNYVGSRIRIHFFRDPDLVKTYRSDRIRKSNPGKNSFCLFFLKIYNRIIAKPYSLVARRSNLRINPVRALILGKNFNQSWAPDNSVRALILGKNFNQSWAPDNPVRALILGKIFNQSWARDNSVATT